MAATAQDSQAPLRASGDGKKDDERDEETEYSPFYGIEKGAVLQESRVFNDREIDARRCQQVITKLLYLLTQGETFTKKEASEVFFAVTKLFQNKDVNLRRMVYLVIKDICPGADEVIIVTSSLMKDMNSKTDLYRSNSIRVLCKITDSGLLGQIERYLKQAVVDKSSVVASAVLVSGIHLLENNLEIVKRWTNEVQEAVQSKSSMVQFHAVALLHALRQNDRLAISKLVSSLTRGNVRSPLAQCLLVRYVSQVIAETQGSSGGERPFYDFLENCLRHKSEMVIFEAARAITNMENVTTRELTPAITVLQLFLSSSKPVLRFGAVRMLNKVAMTHPMAVTNCNIDMESLISDQNRNIATLAITTLLKTGNESSVERLLKQIGNFMSEIADEFKIVVVEAIRSLCLKFPQKHRALMNFLSNILREEGGFEYKKAIVDSILILIREIPQAKESGLGHLCEFIEDCEFTYLSTQILHLLGMEGPKTSDPAKYIRYIYNRIILENATVRAAAVSSLAHFGAECEDLRPRVTTLICRALHDNDDEVRDRATLYLQQLQGSAGGPGCIGSFNDTNLDSLDKSLKLYLSAGNAEPFSLNDVPTVSAAMPSAKAGNARASNMVQSDPIAERKQNFAANLAEVPELAALGKVYSSSEPQKLTEEETEYIVTCIQHVFEAHIVFQFNCTNTIVEQVLEKVSVVMEPSDSDNFAVQDVIELPVMPTSGSGATYVIVEKPQNELATGKFMNTLRFIVKEVDPTLGEAEEEGYEDEYQLEDIDVTASAYLIPNNVVNFRKEWDDLEGGHELEDDYGLGVRNNLQDAVSAVIETLKLSVSEGSDAVPPNARSHVVLLSGRFLDQEVALVRLNFGIDHGNDVAMKMCVRSESEMLCEAIHQIVQDA